MIVEDVLTGRRVGELVEDMLDAEERPGVVVRESWAAQSSEQYAELCRGQVVRRQKQARKTYEP